MQFYQLLNYCVKQLGSGAQVKLESLDQGAINQNYCLHIDQQKYMVKHFVGNRWLPTKRKITMDLQTTLASQGLAPQPIHLSDKQDVYIEQWCPFLAIRLGVNDTETCIDTLAHSLIHIHGSSIRSEVLDIPAHWRKYLKYVDDPDKKWRKKANEYAQIWRDYQQRFASDFVLCHNDLHLSHVDSNNKRYLDWEYAGKGCRFFDLIACCLSNEFDQKKADELTRRYIELSDYHRGEVHQRVSILKPLVIFTHQLWWQSYKAMARSSD